MEYILEINNIVKDYAKHRALDDVSLKIPKGSIYGLLGPNGAGKTSLIRIINQITQPDSGEVKFGAETLQAHHIEQIGYLPEERGLYKKMKVGEQLLYLARLKGLKRSEAYGKIKDWLTRLELQDWWDKEVDSLSKGMQQKVQFISTVLHEPKLIILDEPFSGFDPINANIIKDEILRLKEEGATIIFSTHRMESVEELCDYICLINKSKKVLEGELKQVKEENKRNEFECVIDLDKALVENGTFKMISSDALDGNKRKVLLKLNEGASSKGLINHLAQHGNVEYFAEIIPSANDIFIDKVSQTHG